MGGKKTRRGCRQKKKTRIKRNWAKKSVKRAKKQKELLQKPGHGEKNEGSDKKKPVHGTGSWGEARSAESSGGGKTCVVGCVGGMKANGTKARPEKEGAGERKGWNFGA